MDFEERKYSNANYSTSGISCLSQWLLCWILPLLRKGNSAKRSLSRDDLQSVPKCDRSSTVGNALEKAWQDELKKASKFGRRPKLQNAVLSVVGLRYFLIAALIGIDELIIRISQTLCLKWLVEAFIHGDTLENRYLYAGGVCLTALCHGLLIHPVYFALARIGMRVRVGASSLIYRKTLRLKLGTVTDSTIGQAVNLLSNDLTRFDTYLYNIPYLVIGVVEACILIWFLWVELGVATFAGASFFVVFLPLQYFVVSCSRKYRKHLAGETDARAGLMTQVIDAIRVIKMYAWETPFSEKIQLLRRFEISTLWKTKFIRSLFSSLYLPMPKITTCLTLVTFHFTGNALTSSKVFFAVSVANVLRQSIAVFIPEAASELGELLAVLSRVTAFLLLEEKEPDQDSPQQEHFNRILPEVRFSSATARWSPNRSCLESINLELKQNKLILVVGGVGSGKSALLHAILKELPTVNGTCTSTGKISYSSQVSWIFSGTIKQNILLGLPYDEAKFNTITQVCGLREDLKQLPLGIFTQVGDRGISLSGGQKARVNFARSLYQGGDLILMDDILSALDPKVGRHVFNEAIVKYLGSTLRVLATHQVQFLPQADYIVVLEKGHIQFQGTYEELLHSGIDLSYIVDETQSEKKDSLDTGEECKPIAHNEDVSRHLIENSMKEATQGKHFEKSDEAKGEIPPIVKNVYWKYYRSGNSKCTLLSLFLLFVISTSLYSFVEVWLASWTASVEKAALHILLLNRSHSTRQGSVPINEFLLANDSSIFPEQSTISSDIYLWIYVGVTILVVILTVARTIWFFRVHLCISFGIHNQMFASLMRAPTLFYDQNPSGRIMNRFTKDLGTIDEVLPNTLWATVSNFFLMFGIIVSVIAANYYLTVPAILFLVVLWRLRNFYLQSSRDLKRIESSERSPVFTHLSGSFHGLSTIRASRCEEILIEQFDGLQDNHSAAWYAYIATSRWFGLCIEMASVMFLILVTVTLLVLCTDNSEGTWVGLAISSVLGLAVSFQYGMRQSAEADNMMTSVERALEYTMLKPEAPLRCSPDRVPPKNWPAEGHIQFKHVSLFYSGKPVLKNINFEVKRGERIGIVGRTGAGKSSIVSALFRMTEPVGDIWIDGVRINQIGLHDLRPRISIIPQDPTLFSGSIRYNLDPFSEYGDDEIWKALAAVQLSEKIIALDHAVADGGGNFSVGERQLVCLGRTILRKNKILVLDEMTANIDTRTEKIIQTTIQERFRGCTVLTIAHRLSTIMNSDRVLVLGHGEILEYDTPEILLANSNGIFRSMVPLNKLSSNPNFELADEITRL